MNNGVFLTSVRFAERSALLDRLLQEQGRQPGEVRRTLMTNLIFGQDDEQLQRKLEGRSAAELREQGRLVGTPNEIIAQLQKLAEAGVERIMLQWLDLDDTDGLEGLAHTVLSQL